MHLPYIDDIRPCAEDFSTIFCLFFGSILLYCLKQNKVTIQDLKKSKFIQSQNENHPFFHSIGLFRNDCSDGKNIRSLKRKRNIFYENDFYIENYLQNDIEPVLIVQLSSNPFNAPPPRINNGIAVDSKRYDSSN